MRRQRLLRRRRQNRRTILLPLALPHDDPIPIEIEILDPKAQTFVELQPGAIQKRHYQVHRPGQRLQERRHLLAEHHRQPLQRSRPDDRRKASGIYRQDVAIEKQNCAQRQGRPGPGSQILT